jgi:anti-sigma B factor antagonist
MTHLSVYVTDYPSCTVIVLDGDLNAFSVPLLQQALKDTFARGRTCLVVDVAKLAACDSTGLWALSEGHHCAVAAGGRLSLAYVHGVFKHVLEIHQQAGICSLDVDSTTLE